MLARLAILCVLQLFAHLLSANAANASCYSADSNTIGTASPCLGMLIVDQTMLNTAVANDTYAITGPDSNTYTFGNSSRNIFTGQMTSMYGLFRGKTSFNEDIGYWDVSNVENMSGMFNSASSFTGDLSAWDVGSVTDMSGMFSGATSFNKELSPWTPIAATNMSGMLNMNYDYSAMGQGQGIEEGDRYNVISKFNNGERAEGREANGDLLVDFKAPLKWNTGKVTDMSFMFRENRYFNQNCSTSPVELFLGFIVKSAVPTPVLTACIATQAPVCPA